MASTITVTEITELDLPELRPIARRMVKEMQLAVEKAIAHQAEPTNFPMSSDPNAVERIFHARLTTLRPEQRQLAIARVMPLVKAPVQVRSKIFGDLAQVSLSDTLSVNQQSKALPFPKALKLSPAIAKKLLDSQLATTGETSGGAIAPPDKNQLELRIHKVRCVDETGKDTNPFGDEFGSDEIFLGGTDVDENGSVQKVPVFKVGNFDDGDVKSFSSPIRFSDFNLHEGTQFPKTYFVTLVLAEKDMGGLPDFVDKLFVKVKEHVTAAIIAAFGELTGASGIAIGVVISKAVKFVLDKIFGFLQQVWSDDIFLPKLVSVSIPSLSHRFAGGKTDSPEAIVKFASHNGTYEVTYDWRMFN